MPTASDRRDITKHRDRDGNVVNIAGMSDDHLKRTISLFSNTMTSATEGMLQNPQELSPRAKALYGGTCSLMTPDEYRKMVRGYYNRIGPYVLEAALRGLDVKDVLCKALGRIGRDPEAPEAQGSLTIRNNQVVFSSPPTMNAHEQIAGLLTGELDEDDLEEYEEE